MDREIALLPETGGRNVRRFGSVFVGTVVAVLLLKRLLFLEVVVSVFDRSHS